MIKRKIHVSNLRVRLPRRMAGDAKNIAAGIGKDVIRGIADAAKGKTGRFRIDKISAGKFESSIGVGEIQKQVTANLVSAIAKKMDGGGV